MQGSKKLKYSFSCVKRRDMNTTSKPLDLEKRLILHTRSGPETMNDLVCYIPLPLKYFKGHGRSMAGI